MRERDGLRDTNRRPEHLIAALNQLLQCRRSEKLNDVVRQLGFEDLKTAVDEAETRQDAGASPRTPPRPNRGHLLESLPGLEQVIELDSLLCPCGWRVAMVPRTLA